MRIGGAVAVLVLSLLLNGCWFGKKKQPVSVPPPAPKKVKLEPPPAVETKPVATAPPGATIEQPLPPPPAEQQPQAKPPKRTPRTRPPSAARGSVKKTPAAPAPPVVESTPPQQPAPAGKLGEILTDEQKLEYRRSFQQSDSAARQLISTITRHQLTSDQQDVLARIRSFLQQATEAASNDWSLAAQLARRAELLARDLASTIR